LTRTLDWSENLPEALSTGARAVSSPSPDPLAHIYYAEALADSGLFTQAERELRTAESMKRDRYATAETDREWANYYRDRGDDAQALNHIQLALREQPDFPERDLELARTYYGGKKGDQARQQLDKVRRAHPQSYWVQVGAAESALFSADTDTAQNIFANAERLRPAGPEAQLGLAEVGVVARRDFQGARRRLTDSLKQNPASGETYQYLKYLDKLVLHVDPADDLRPAGPEAGAALAASRKGALERVNQLRAQAGLAAVPEDSAIAEAAQSHAYFYLFNLGRPQLNGLGIHLEDSNLPGFTGANSIERDRHAGYRGTRGAEVINHVYSPQAAVQVWQDSVFHRFPIISRETAAAGYGEASIGVVSIQIIDFGLDPAGVSDPVVWPVPDAKDLMPSFVGHEIPDPAPQGVQYPTGYPITFQAGSRSQLQVTTGRLLDGAGQEVQTFAVPRDNLGPNEWSIMAVQPLKPGATYTVDLAGQLDGGPYSKRWSFTTENLPTPG
jgi:uncharacterized protein YkwD